jgi:hypothetical protein
LAAAFRRLIACWRRMRSTDIRVLMRSLLRRVIADELPAIGRISVATSKTTMSSAAAMG